MTLSKLWRKSGSSELSKNKVVGTAVAAALAVYAAKKAYPLVFKSPAADTKGEIALF